MPFEATTPLGRALAAIIASLIAALAEHAAEHPVLAPSLRATMRQLEDLARRFDALVSQHAARRRRPTVERIGDWILRNAPNLGMRPAARPCQTHRPAARDPPQARLFFL